LDRIDRLEGRGFLAGAVSRKYSDRHGGSKGDDEAGCSERAGEPTCLENDKAADKSRDAPDSARLKAMNDDSMTNCKLIS